MSQETTLDTQLEECLDVWGISLLDEWDLLVFLRRHRASLITVEQISRLLGIGKPALARALEKMERTGLLRRSRSSQRVRIYQLLESVDPPRQGHLEMLLRLIETPVERGLMASKLGHAAHTGKKLRRSGLYLT